MKTCVNCGNVENSNNALSCSRCGGMLVKPERTCPSCGAPMELEMSFCPKCGSAVGKSDAPYPSGYPGTDRLGDVYSRREVVSSSSGGNKAIMTLLIIVCVILVASVSVVAFLIMDDKKDDKGASAGNGTESVSGQNGDTSDGNETKPEPVPEPPKESRYVVYKNNSTWYNAYNHAKSMGGHLVCINDKQEFDKVCAMANANKMKVFWLGAFVEYAGQSWSGIRWINGEPFSYTKWYPGEPTGVYKGSAETYLMAFNVKGIWYYNDAANDVSSDYNGKMGYIVEFEQ